MESGNQPTETSALAARVRGLRIMRGMGVRELARAASVDATWLSRLEQGRYSSPDARLLSRLARALEVDVEELYLAAGYSDGRGLPGFVPYLRAKYELPEEAVTQLEAHFELLNEKYLREKGGRHERSD